MLIKLKQPLGVSSVKKEVILFTEQLPVKPSKRYMDMGTGTGYTAIYLSKKGLECEGADISKGALKVAEENSLMNGVRIKFYNSDFFSKINKKYDFIMFNAPFGTTKSNYFLEFIKSLLRRSELIRKLLLIAGVRFCIKNRVKINSRFIREALNHLNEKGSLFLLLYKKELPYLKSKFKGVSFSSKDNPDLKKLNPLMVIIEVKR